MTSEETRRKIINIIQLNNMGSLGENHALPSC